MTNRKQVLSYLKSSYLFSGVSEKGLNIILQSVRENRFAGGETVFSEGDSGDSLHIIVSGVIKVIKYGREGKTKTLAILRERDSFGEMALLTKEARSATIEALEDTVTLSISRADFENLVMSEPSISLQIIKTLSERLAKADRDIKILALGDAKSRVACVIMDFKDEIEKVKFTHQEIGDLAGLTRETTTRTLKQMEEEGLISVNNRKIKIKDAPGLKELCL